MTPDHGTLRKVVLPLAIAFGLCGCTAPTDLVPRTVTIRASVPGAAVAIDGKFVGTTPFTVDLPREPVVVAVVSARDHAPQPVPLTSTFDPSVRMDVFWGYTTTDSMTRSVWEYAPSAYYVELQPANAPVPEASRHASLKSFAMTYFGDIQVELAAGDGPKLRMLHENFFPRRDRRGLRQAMEDAPHDDPVVFAEAVAALAPLP